MKLDLSAAWDGAVRMLSRNKDTLLVLGGVFFFLPYLAFSLFVPEADTAAAMEGSNPDYDAAFAAVQGIYAEYWWALLLLAVVQSIGLISVLAVLGDPARPTVGAAIERGVKFLLPQIGAQLLTALAIFALVMIAVVAGVALGAGAAVLIALLVIPIVIYLVIKFSLAAPSIAIDRIANPLGALAQSWRLTKGNSLRLFAFYALLLVALIVVSTVLSLIVGLVLALLGEGAALIGGGIVMSVLNTIFALVAYAVLASVHRQLSGGGASVPRTARDE